MVEGGDWVARGPDAWTERGFFEHSPSFNRDTPFDATAEGQRSALGTFLCVGGASVFFGGVSMRMREADFTPDPDIVQDSRRRVAVHVRGPRAVLLASRSAASSCGHDRRGPD